MESLEARSDAALETAAATVRFALTTVGAAAADGAKARLILADSHLGVVPFEGVRVDQLELDVPGMLSPAEVAAGPSALRNRRCELRRLHFSVEESALSRMLARSLDPASGVESISVRLFPDHVRVYLEIADEGRGTQTRVVLAASTDVDEAGSLVLSFYGIRVFGRLPGQVPASLVGRIVPADAARFVERAGATRVAVRPLAALLTSWLPAAGWKVPDSVRAQDRHVTLRGDRLYFHVSQTATPGLVSETTTARNLSAFEYAEAERLFEDAEARLRDGDLDGALAIYRTHGDPESGHPFALRRLTWILVAKAGAGGESGDVSLIREARAAAEGLKLRFPDDPVALETAAAIALLEADRGVATREAAAEAYEALAARCTEENDLRGRVFAELFLGELYAAPGPGADLELARGAYEAALALDPGCVAARRAVAEVYRKTGEPKKAVEAWNAVLEAQSDVGERRSLLLKVAETELQGLNDADAAIQTYREAQESDDPETPTVAAWEGLARAYAAKGDAPAAIRQLERVADRCVAIGDRRGAARANFTIGELWAGPLRRPESALLRFEKALELDPDHVGSLERRWRLRKERRAWAEAVRAGTRLAEAIVATGESGAGADAEPAAAKAKAVAVLLEVADLAARELSDAPAAAAAAAQALESDPDSEVARAAAEQRYAATGNEKGLADLYALVAPRAGSAASYEIHLRRGELLAGPLGDASGAADEFAAACAAAPDTAKLDAARERLAASQRGLGRLTELRDLRAAQWKSKQAGKARAPLALEVGRVQRELGEPADAAIWFERATQDDPACGDAFAALGELAAERGDVGGHVEALLARVAAETEPKVRATVRTEAAALLLSSVEDAQAAAKEAGAAIAEEEAAPGVAPAEAWKVLGRAKLALGDLDGAAQALESWFHRKEAELSGTGGIPAAPRAEMALEVAQVHAKRSHASDELIWLRRKLEADPIDAAATRRAAQLARGLGPNSLAAELVESEARLASDRTDASRLFVEAGQLWEKDGRADKAEEAFRAAASATPQDEAPLEALADMLLGEGRVEDAIEVWRAAADQTQGPASIGRWRRAAILAATRGGDAEAAARAFNRVLAIDPEDKAALEFLAERARAAGNWKKARELFEILADVTADAPPAECAALAMRRAEAAERDGDPAAAEERYRLAASLEPASREPFRALKRIASAVGRHDQAADAAEQEARRVPEVSEKAALLFEAGRIALERLADPQRAALRFHEALDLEPGNMPALDALENLLGPLQDFGGLFKVLNEKARLLRDPKRKAELLTRAAEIAWEKLGDFDRAKDAAMAGRTAATDDPRPLAFLEKMYRAERRWELLAPLLEERAGTLPEPAREPLVVEAATLRAHELADFDRAATDLERAALDGAVSPALFRLLVEVQKKRGDHPRVAAALTKLAAVTEDRAEKAATLLELGRLTGDVLGDPASSLRWLTEAKTADPASREVASELRTRLADAKKWAELAALETEIGSREGADPKDAAENFRRAAELYRDRLDDVAGAVRCFRKALAADPDDQDSLASADMLLVARGDHATRAELFRTRLRARPDDLVAREGLLSSLAAAGSWGDLETELKPFAESEPVAGPSVKRLLLAYRSAGRWKDLMRFLENRVAGGEASARELLEAVYAEREDWRGLAEFHLRQAEGKGGRERARAVAAASAVLRERMHDLDRSRAILREGVAAAPEDYELFEATAESFESAGDMEGLRDLLLDVGAKLDGPARVPHLRRAATITRERLGDTTRSLALYREVLGIDPDDDESAERAIEILGARHDWAGVVALQTERGERSRDPKKRASYHRAAGVAAKTRLGDPFRAAAAYRAALAIDSDDAAAFEGAEEALEAGERWEELTELRATRAGKGDAADRAHALIGAAVIARDKLSDPERALSLFRAASKENPSDPVPVDAAAAILGQLGRIDELASWLLASAGSLPEKDGVARRMSAAELLLENADSPAHEAKAVEALCSSLEVTDPVIAEQALRAASSLLESHGRWPSLLTVYRAAANAPALAGRRSAIHAATGALVRDRLGDPAAAAESFRKALEVDPGNAPAFAALERWYRDTSDWEALLLVYETDAGFASEPAHKSARYQAMAELRANELGDPAGATNDLKRALDATPADLTLVQRYEAMLSQAGKWPELAEALIVRASRTAAPASAAAITVWAADVLSDKVGDLDRAAQLYESARAGSARPEEPLLGLERIWRKKNDAAKLAPVLEARGEMPGEPRERSRQLLEAGVLRRVRLDDLDTAEKDLTRSITLDAESVDALRELREVHRARSHWLQVDETLEAEERLTPPDSTELLAALAYERGLVFRDGFRDNGRAAFHLGRAVKLHPGYPDASRALAEVSEAIEAWGVARMEWRRLAQLTTDPAQAIGFLERAAGCAVKSGDVGGAIEHLEDLVEVGPDRLESWDRLADGYLSLKRWDEARIVLAELLTRTSKTGDARRTVAIYYRLARAEKLVGQVEKAAGRLKRLLAADAEHEGALTLLAEIHRERSEWGPLAEVLPRLAKVSSAGSHRADFWREAGATLEHRLGRTAEAMEAYAQAIAADGNDVESMWRLSDLAFQNGRNDIFLTLWARLSPKEAAPARKLALAWRAGEALKRTGRPKEAAREYEKALEIDPSHLPSWSALAGLLEEGRDWRRAVAAWDGALRALGSEPGERAIPVLVRRGMILADRVGDYEAAAADLKRAVQVKPEDLNLRFRLAGVLAKAKGGTSEAIGVLREILARDPFRADVYRSLGEIHGGSASPDPAFAAYSSLALIDPSDVAARAFLDANKSKIDQGMLKALDEGLRGQLLFHPAARAEPMRTGMTALIEVVSQIWPAAADRTGLIPIDLTAGTPLARMIDSIRVRLGLSALTLFVRPAAVASKRDTLSDLVVVEAGEQPALIVDDTLAAAVPDRRGALFLLGKFLERLKGGYSVYLRRTPEELDHLAWAIRKAFVPGASDDVKGLSAEQASNLVKALRKGAPRKYKNEIEDVAGAIDAAALHAWVEGLRHTENRAGLLIANDLVQATRVVLGLDPNLARYDLDTVPDRIAHLKRSDEVAEMLRFVNSDDAFALRKAVGLTLEPKR